MPTAQEQEADPISSSDVLVPDDETRRVIYAAYEGLEEEERSVFWRTLARRAGSVFGPEGPVNALSQVEAWVGEENLGPNLEEGSSRLTSFHTNSFIGSVAKWFSCCSAQRRHRLPY